MQKADKLGVKVSHTTLHEMQTRSSDENSVYPSTCVFIKRMHCDKTEEKSVQIFIPYKRSFRLVL